MSEEPEEGTEEPSARKKPGPEPLPEPPLGWGRDFELDPKGGPQRLFLAALFVSLLALGAALLGLVVLEGHRNAGGMVLCALLLGGCAAYLFALYLRNAGREDLVARFTREGVSLPRVALVGPQSFECAWRELEPPQLMMHGAQRWIALKGPYGQEAIVPVEWAGAQDLEEVLLRIDLRRTLALERKGPPPRALLVGAEALLDLRRRGEPAAGVVVGRVRKKRPVVYAFVGSVDEFEARRSEWPEGSKLYLPRALREQLEQRLADTSDLL